MRQQTKRFLSFLLAFFFVIAALVVYVQFTQSVYDEILALRREAVSRENFLNKQKQIVDAVENLIAIAEGDKEVQIQDAISLALPQEEDVPGALAQIHGIAQATRVQLQSIGLSIDEGKAPRLPQGTRRATSTAQFAKPLGTLTMRIKAQGAYADFKKFLEGIETNVRIFEVRELSLTPVGRPDQDFLGYDLTVVTYFENI